MSIPLPLPEWLPPWVTTALLIVVILYGLAFLFMPFSVIGVKSRLDAIEAELEALHTELRSLTLRLPETPPRGSEAFAAYVAPAPAPSRPLSASPSASPPPPIPPREPPIPRPAPDPGLRVGAPRPSAAVLRQEEERRAASQRTEPRLEWRPR
jgi:uncharacterized membrane protein